MIKEKRARKSMTRVRKRVKKASTNYSSMEHPPITPSSYGTRKDRPDTHNFDALTKKTQNRYSLS